MILRFRNPTLVKRIDRIYEEEKSLRVLGDNDNLNASWDSRHFGNIKFENIEHIVEETISLRDNSYTEESEDEDRRNNLKELINAATQYEEETELDNK